MTKLNGRVIRNIIWVLVGNIASVFLVLAQDTIPAVSPPDYVLELNSVNFNRSVLEDEFSVWVVCFCTSWCDHCISFQPEYKKSALVMRSVVKFGTVDCDKETALGAEYRIGQVPTIKIFVDEKENPRDYNGCKKASALVEAVLWDLRCMVHQRLLAAGSISPMISPPNDNNTNDDCLYGTCLLSEQQKTPKKTIAINQSNIPTKIKERKNSKPILDKMKSMRFWDKTTKPNASVVIQLNDTSFRKKVLETRGCWVVVFYAPWCCHSRCLAPHWLDAANRLKGKMSFGAVDCTANRYLACKYNISTYPTILLFPDGSKHVRPEIYNGSRNALDIINWCLSKWDEEIPDNEVLELFPLWGEMSREDGKE